MKHERMVKGGIYVGLLMFGGMLNYRLWQAQMQHDIAMDAAMRFSRNLAGASKVECVKWDTDGDGYVSCMIFRDGVIVQRNGADATDTDTDTAIVSAFAVKMPLAIECGHAGCRVPKR